MLAASSPGLGSSRRRQALIALAASLLAAPLASYAQQAGKVWRVGFMAQRAFEAPFTADVYSEFSRGMGGLGYVEGRNLLIEWRSGEGNIGRLPDLAAELVQLSLNVIVTVGAPATKAMQQATTAIPIVMASVGDPVGQGLVKSLARPGGNTTGLSNLNLEIGPKRLEMLLRMVPKLSRVAVLVNPDNGSGAVLLSHIQAAAPKLRVTVLPLEARSMLEIERAFVTMIRQKAGAVIVAQDQFLIQQRRQVAELAAKHRLPSISGYRDYTIAGGLMSYGQNLGDNYRRAATFVDKIFKGAKPSDLPVEQPITVELFINRKTAKALGLAIPQSLLISADKVIE